ncbi:hypothetical protein MHF_1259 [Mycoplasma haemofelis Ohio2]|uniref:Uncharacterized protein n=1 Tax=Mycoplasma haemofelis (strain Ohio2) TaxID=859194 RepID=F6FFS7_MYCHI|nr:hypothetical protein MHF_1259 [Mycoplasma haemofelis Ohio2]
MVKSLVFKLSALGLTGTAVSVGAVMGIFKSSDTTQILKDELRHKIKKDRGSKRRALDASDAQLNPYWKANWDQYKSDNQGRQKGEDTFKLEDWTANPPQDTPEVVPQSFVNACLKSDDKSHEDLLKYCYRDSMIFDLIEGSGLRALDTSFDANHPKWIKAWERYKASKGDAWKLSTSDNGSSVPEAFKTKCDDNLASPDIENDELLDQIMSWCIDEDK